MDVWYVDHWSIAVDLRIIASTVKQVLGREGVATVQSPNEISLPERFHIQPSERTVPGPRPPTTGGTSADRTRPLWRRRVLRGLRRRRAVGAAQAPARRPSNQ